MEVYNEIVRNIQNGDDCEWVARQSKEFLKKIVKPLPKYQSNLARDQSNAIFFERLVAHPYLWQHEDSPITKHLLDCSYFTVAGLGLNPRVAVHSTHMQQFRKTELYWLALHARSSLVQWRQNSRRLELLRSWVTFVY